MHYVILWYVWYYLFSNHVNDMVQYWNDTKIWSKTFFYRLIRQDIFSMIRYWYDFIVSYHTIRYCIIWCIIKNIILPLLVRYCIMIFVSYHIMKQYNMKLYDSISASLTVGVMLCIWRNACVLNLKLHKTGVTNGQDSIFFQHSNLLFTIH